jgi:hypothetical protein
MYIIVLFYSVSKNSSLISWDLFISIFFIGEKICYLLQHCGLFMVLVISFNLPWNLKFKCEFKFTKYLKKTTYLFIIYQGSQIQILSNLTEYKQLFTNRWKTEIEQIKFSDNIIFYLTYLQIHHSNFAQQV